MSEAGIILYIVGIKKEIPGSCTCVSVDGAMVDNIRPALYWARYCAEVANKAERDKDKIAMVAGRCCESGNILF